MSTSFYIINPKHTQAMWVGKVSDRWTLPQEYMEESFIYSLLYYPYLPRRRGRGIAKDFRERITELSYEEFIIQMALGVIPPFHRNMVVPRDCRYFAYKEEAYGNK